MAIKRRKTRTVKIGRVKIGSSYPIAIQSMVKVSVRDVRACIAQIRRLQKAGCEIVRVAVENAREAAAIKEIKRRVHLPLVADIHFDYRLALAAIEAGVDKIRLNPGNIYKPAHVRAVIAAARNAHIPIRIGANSGSLKIRRRDTAQALVESVREYLGIFRRARFSDIVISLKASSLPETVRAYQKMAKACDYPFHVGLTATGLPLDGIVKSSAGIGVLLFEGIGDTIRLSLLDDSVQEVRAAQSLLSALQVRFFGPEMICCPTCGRCEVDLAQKAQVFARRLRQLSPQDQARLKACKIALMGCIVNGPGEAKESTLGIAFSRRKGAIFKRGKIFKTVDLDKGEQVLFELVKAELSKGAKARLS